LEALMAAMPWIAGGLILVILLVLLRRPLRGLARLLARTGVWLAVLFGISQVGTFIGVNLGVNLANALLLGILGVPGLGLLLMVHWALL
jgi:inhibitor of the pro-sigma K processing machinery